LCGVEWIAVIGSSSAQFRGCGRTGLGDSRVEPWSPSSFTDAGYMSTTVLRVRGFRLYFFSREETRMHIHVYHADGEAKFWLEPVVEVAANYGLNSTRLGEATSIIEEHLDEIRSAWAKHFPGGN